MFDQALYHALVPEYSFSWLYVSQKFMSTPYRRVAAMTDNKIYENCHRKQIITYYTQKFLCFFYTRATLAPCTLRLIIQFTDYHPTLLPYQLSWTQRVNGGGVHTRQHTHASTNAIRPRRLGKRRRI